jgi:hypothetical protein
MDATEHTPLLLPLVFDDEADERVPFVLTAAAHRAVGDDGATRLRVVDDQPQVAVRHASAPAISGGAWPAGVQIAGKGAEAGAHDDADVVDGTDTRRAQARALLRSGMPVATIAAALGVPDAVVASWTGDVELRRRRRGRARTAPVATPMIAPAFGSASASSGALAAVAPALPEVLDHTDPVQRGVLAGLVLALLEVDEDGLSLRHDRVEPVALLLDALRAALPLPDERIRVAVKVAADLAIDRTRALVADRLGVDADRIVAGRWASAPSAQAFQVRLDVVDAGAAQLVSGWLRDLRPAAQQPTLRSHAG